MRLAGTGISWNTCRRFQIPFVGKLSLRAVGRTVRMRFNDTQPLDIAHRPRGLRDNDKLGMVGKATKY